MTRTKNDLIKPLQKIEISVTEILIAGDGSLKPYIQTFHHEPENIALQPLGSVFGIFEIEDHSEDSAYIVNFLASVVKKEYFSHPKRAAIESLEATLHKINLALSELIKQDNTAWLGKLNATLCVFEKNNVHFSVSGKAKTLLVRGGVLSDISDGLAEESNTHPLKTFTEVSSGRLKSDDKVILTTPGLFELFSPQELQKNAKRFSNEKFSQFLKTALVNQLLFGGTLIIDIAEADCKEPILKKSTSSSVNVQDIPNAFSQSAFSAKKSPAAARDIALQTPLSELINETLPENDYTDSKTGHIYVQGDVPEVASNETWIHIQWVTEELFETFISETKKLSTRCFKNVRTFFEKRPLPAHTKPKSEADAYAQEPLENKSLRYASSDQESSLAVRSSFKDSFSLLWQRIRSFLQGTVALKNIPRTIAPILRKIPRWGAIRQEFSRLSPTQKKYAIAALVSIFIIPFLIIKLQGPSKAVSIPVEEKAPIATPGPLSSDKNTHFIASTQSVLTNNAVITTLLLKDTLFAVTKNTVVNLEDPKKTQAYPLPEAYGASIIRATAMNDLNVIFLLTDTGKIISFTPSNHAFTENHITLPDASHITDMATYLTYLYILDSKSDTIHRYPRSDGGFGEDSLWLKETVAINDTDTMAINEDLYLTQNDHLIAFNKGRRDPISIEDSATPIIFSEVFTQTDTQFLYVLDAVNGRLIQFERSGAIVNQYAQDKIKESSSITVDEQNRKAYFTTSSEVFLIALD
ncbi:MAG: hypothetical protein PHT88_02400 [Candidatus Moranbacteria bacterium]|nr:hypothetical protein [Candidatus Moranbacteria bacterium]